MSLSREEVEHIALLARLSLSEEELERYRQQLSSILDHFTKLQTLDTADVPGLSSVLAESLTLRRDQAGQSLPTPDVLANAPSKAADQFRVPPVLDYDDD
jgi:aspartyl-tRNA(Asn)/glutamyl-tRNA(Gln) amidotransferase subunit C